MANSGAMKFWTPTPKTTYPNLLVLLGYGTLNLKKVRKNTLNSATCLWDVVIVKTLLRKILLRKNDDFDLNDIALKTYFPI